MDEDSDSSDARSGILLLGEAEKAPDYLDLSLEVEESDVDEPEAEQEVSSDEEVVVLGEKRPSYPEITLDEDDDDGEVCCEKVVEVKKRVRIPRDLEDLLYDCPKCEKKFRVESLLKFHIRMHSVVESHGRQPHPPETPRATQKYCRKEKENNKLNSKSLHKHKIQKHAKRKAKIPSS